MKRTIYRLLGPLIVLLAAGCTSSSVMRDARSKHYHFVGRFQVTQTDLRGLSPSNTVDRINRGQSLPTRTVPFMLFYYDSNQLPDNPDGSRLFNYPNQLSLVAYIPTGCGKWQNTELFSGSRIQFLAAAPSPDERKVFVVLSNAFQMDLGDPPPENPNRPYVMEIILAGDGLKLVDEDYTFNQIFHNKAIDATSQ